MTDIHNHILYGADDGAADEQAMFAMLDAAYAEGIRTLCATPHFHPGFFGDNREAVRNAFEKLKKYAGKYPDLKLCLGNELRYSAGCLEWLETGQCRTLNDGRYLLVDFVANDSASFIVSALQKLMNDGYHPILAHAERYNKLYSDNRELRYLKRIGVIIQLDASSIIGKSGYREKVRSRKILKDGLADVVASDAHDLKGSAECLRPCHDYVEKKAGHETAERLFSINPTNILSGTI